MAQRPKEVDFCFPITFIRHYPVKLENYFQVQRHTGVSAITEVIYVGGVKVKNSHIFGAVADAPGSVFTPNPSSIRRINFHADTPWWICSCPWQTGLP